MLHLRVGQRCEAASRMTRAHGSVGLLGSSGLCSHPGGPATQSAPRCHARGLSAAGSQAGSASTRAGRAGLGPRRREAASVTTGRRLGGRAARVATKAAGPEKADRPVRPGHSGGRFAPLTDSEMQHLYDAALKLLEDVGMADAIPEFVEVVTDAGGRVGDDGRLRFPRGLVERTFETAAREWVFHGFDEENSLELSDRRVHFGTAGAAVLVLDYETRAFRRSTIKDLYDFARLADTLEHIHFFKRTVVATELEDLRALDLNTAYACLMGTSKPIGTCFFKKEHVYDAVDMFDTALGGEGEFRKRPFVCSNTTFVVPPLRFAIDAAEGILAQVETGMPINLLSAGQAGATAPAPLAGALVQGLAECLAGLSVVNLLSPGHPCVMGIW